MELRRGARDAPLQGRAFQRLLPRASLPSDGLPNPRQVPGAYPATPLNLKYRLVPSELFLQRS